MRLLTLLAQSALVLTVLCGFWLMWRDWREKRLAQLNHKLPRLRFYNLTMWQTLRRRDR